MNHNHLIKILYIAVIIIFTGCDGISKRDKENLPSTYTADNHQNKRHEENIDIKISDQTTDNLCQVAQFLDQQNFIGDFYLHNGSIDWGMDVDSVEISHEIISLLLNEEIEYVARTRGIIQFGFFPTEKGERGLLLNTEPTNPLITSGNVTPKFTKLNNSKCLDLNWYYQSYK